MHWFNGGIAEAVGLSKARNAIFVVYIEGTDEQSKLMSDLLDQPEVSSRLDRESDFVTIKLKSGSEAYTQFAQIYQLVPVPSIFFIWENGTPLEVVAGTVAGGATGLAARIDALVAKKLNSKASPMSMYQPSTSSSNPMASSSSAFLAGEQGASAMASQKPIPTVQVDQASSPEEDPDEFETVCEGGVCFRRPKAVSTPEKTEPESPSKPPGDDSTPHDEAPTEKTEEVTKEVVKTAEEMTVEEKVERAKELLEKKRKEKEEKEKEEERQRELDRRAQGHGAAELKRWQQEQELKTLKEERLREKQENDKARARILEQIAQDRADRQARFAPVPATTDTSTPNSSPSQPSAFTPSTDTSNITRIQFKMADGSTHTTQMDSDSTLGELRQHVRENIQTSGAFTLSTMYPRRVLPETDDDATLRSLGLSPSASLLVMRGTTAANSSSVKAGGAVSSSGSSSGSPIANAGGFFGMITQLFWSVVVRPAQDLYNWLSSLVSGGGGGRRPAAGGQSGSQMGSSGGIRRQQSEGESGAKRRRVVPSSGGGAGSSSVRREGNTYRLRDQDSDDENNTWNGNSTQQM